MTLILDILTASWNVFTEVSVYMLLGFFVAGLLFVFFKAEMISKHLGKGKVKPVLLSAIMGIPIPLCSCGVIPAAAGLKKQGANKGSALSFLIATPESGVDSIAVSYAMLDPIMTVARPVAAFFTAITAGLAENFFGKEEKKNPFVMATDGGPIHGGGCSGHSHGGDGVEARPLGTRLRSGLRYAFGELVDDISRSFVIGILIAGLITCFVPDDLSAFFAGNGFLSMFAMLVVGIPMYVCATASTPIVAALILKGLNPGAAIVFLLAGPATNAATMGMVADLFDKRTLAIYLGSIVVCSMIMGFLVDLIYRVSGISAHAVVGQAAEIFPPGVELGASVILAALILVSLGKRFFLKKTSCSCC